MTKNYSKEVDDIHNQIANSQKNLFQLLEKVTKERDTLDMEKERLERKMRKQEKALSESRNNVNRLEDMLEHNQYWGCGLTGKRKGEGGVFFVITEEEETERRKFDKTIATLHKKLNEETVDLTVIIEKIKKRAKTHGITAAGSMFDTVCLLLGDVTAWQKNKGDLESFFAEYNEKKNDNENHFNIEKVDQMAVGDDATLNHGI